VSYRHWKNLNGFCALLTSEGLDSTEYRALYCTYTALESQPKKKKDLKSIVEYQVPIAAIYFQICPTSLHDACVRGWGRDSSNWAGDLWTGEKGYSLARWAFWKNRFAELGSSDLAGEDVKSMVTKALIQMDEAERASSI
jgi:hypothetical protein